MPGLDVSIALVAVAPFLAAILAPFAARFAGAMAGWVLGIVPASILVFLLGFAGAVADGAAVAAGFDWIPAYGIRFSFFIDGLSLTFALLAAGIGALTLIYSGAHLAGHPHQGRFLAFLLMLTGAMLGLVLADDMVTLFVFWELAAVAAFLLIGFDHRRQAARRAAIQSLTVAGGGGLALLLGLIVLQYMTGSWELSAIRTMGEELRAGGFYLPVLLLVLAGAVTKSAQVPFHFWLPNTVEAPTPAVALLHAAGPATAGVYLLARMVPVLGGTPEWTAILGIFGGVTLLWGGLAALRQTDLRQMLAHATVASLGLMVLLIGLGTGAAITAAIVYLVAHALAKAALLLVAGTLDQHTGTRDLTGLGGLGRAMPLSFLGAALAGLTMAGIWPAIGVLAGERMYAATATLDWYNLVALAVLLVGSALVMAVGLAVALLPFLGPPRPTPIAPREGSPGLVLGPLALGALAVAATLWAGALGATLVAPAIAAVLGEAVAVALSPVPDLMTLAILFTVLTWVLGGMLFWRIETARTLLRRAEARIGWSFDAGFDWLMFGLVRAAGRITRLWHHGRLDLYMAAVFVALAAVLYLPLIAMDAVPPIPSLPDLRFHEWAIFAVALAGLAALVMARTRTAAIAALGAQGLIVALVFVLFGAPDLALAQVMAGTVAVAMLALAAARLRLGDADHRELEPALRDGGIALVCGLGLVMLAWAVLQTALDQRLPEFYAATGVPLAGSRNLVSAILLDYRGLDMLVAIAVLTAAGIVILSLLRRRPVGGSPAAAPRRGRRTTGKGAAA